MSVRTKTRERQSVDPYSQSTAADLLGGLPRFLLTREESAQVLGMSLSHFQRHVQPHVPCVYSGQLRQYRPEDLKAWAEMEACERQ